jgi:predicted ATPase/DNA-binding XRE family transcriptional regulator
VEPTFATLLRAARIDARLSQEQLAEAAKISPAAISAYERGLRTRPHRETVRMLAAALQLSASDLTAFEKAARQKATSQALADIRPAHGLPSSTTSFVGRIDESIMVRELLGRHRVVTLTGPGGIGKTRLALHVASEMLSERDAVYLIDLASISDGQYVIEQVALALGAPHLQTADQVIERLKNHEPLLVLDNCEHVLDAVSVFAAALVRNTSGVSLLATSRERLRISGEAVYRIPVLPLPFAPPATIDAALESSAIQLFVARASAADAAFRVDDADSPRLYAICQRLEGMPLALELAASQVPILGLSGLQLQLQQHLSELAGGSRDMPKRQRTLRETIEWSYGLLETDEQVLFRRLSVFVSGWTLEAAEHVCNCVPLDSKVVRSGMAALVEKSLVNLETAPQQPRYRMQEVTRANSAEMLTTHGESDVAMLQHAGWIAVNADRALNDGLFMPREAWQERYYPELENIRAALRWATSDLGDPQIGFRILAGFNHIWLDQGHLNDLRMFASAVLTKVNDSTSPFEAGSLLHILALTMGGEERKGFLDRAIPLLSTAGYSTRLGHALATLGRLYHNQGKLELAMRELDKSKEMYEAASVADSLWMAHLEYERSYVLRKLERNEEALEAHRHCIALSVKFGDVHGESAARMFEAERTFAEGDIATSLDLATTVLERLEGRSEKFALTMIDVLANRAAYRLASGDAAGAYDDALRGLVWSRSFDPWQWAYEGLAANFLMQHLAAAIAQNGEAARAARIAGYIEASLKRTSTPRGPTEQRSFDILMASLSEQLSAKELGRLMGAGAELDEASAVQLAVLNDSP